MAIRTILFPTDFSGRCDRPRERAIRLARLWGAKLVLLHVLKEADAETAGYEQREAMDQVNEKLRREVQVSDIEVERRIASGNVAEAIVKASLGIAADIIVLGISRRDEIGDVVLGTTVERVVQDALVPVLVVKNQAQGDYATVMVATDFSNCSAAALRTAAETFPDAEITLVHAYHVPLEKLRGREGPAAALQAGIALEMDHFLNSVGLPREVRDHIELNVDYGDVCSIACDHIRTSGTDLAVVGTHGRSGFVATVVGSTARALTTCLDCDVLLVRQAP